MLDKVGDPHAVSAPTNTFRQVYRKLTVEEVRALELLKAKAAELEDLILGITPGRHRSLAITRLEECLMWATKGLSS